MIDLLWGGIFFVVIATLLLPKRKRRGDQRDQRPSGGFWRKLWTHDSSVIVLRLPRAKMMRLKADAVEQRVSLSAIVSRKLERSGDGQQRQPQFHNGGSDELREFTAGR